jgi:hypothetical protein
MFINGLYINAQRVGLRLLFVHIYNLVKCNGCIYYPSVCVWEAVVVTQLIGDVTRYMLRPSQYLSASKETCIAG